MACLSQVVVMLSGKCLEKNQPLCHLQHQRYIRAFNDKHVVLLPQTQHHPTLHQLLLPRLAEPIRIACAVSLVANTTKKQNLPLLRHKIFTWFPRLGSVNASNVGAKNIASSSGCAISRHILLFLSVGNRDFATETVYSQQAIATIGRLRMVSHSSCMAVRGMRWLGVRGRRDGVGGRESVANVASVACWIRDDGGG